MIFEDKKDRPILFQAEMVRAILDDRKTETRRIMNPQPRKLDVGPHIQMAVEQLKNIFLDAGKKGYSILFGKGPFAGMVGPVNQHGDVGHTLWVRETWFIMDGVNFQADYPETYNFKEKGIRLKPSIFLKKLDARIFLEVTGTSPENLQDITNTGAVAEGVKYIMEDDEHFPNMGGPLHFYNYLTEQYEFKDRPIDSYMTLWDKIHGKGHHKTNPAVWVTKFRRIKKNGLGEDKKGEPKILLEPDKVSVSNA